MLSDPKASTQWVLSPRVTAWSQDENKFGQRLLEQMGWEKGKGLGKDLSGIRDHIRPHFQSCSKGLGYEGPADGWIAHQDELNSILTGLQSQYSQDSSPSSQPSVASLEVSSRKSRSRLHYQKFTRGKDLSRYSADDMAAIMGNTNKPRHELPQPRAGTYDAPSDGGAGSGRDAEPSAPTYNSALSLKDYFASKMKKRCAHLRQHETEAAGTCQSGEQDTVPSTEEFRDVSHETGAAGTPQSGEQDTVPSTEEFRDVSHETNESAPGHSPRHEGQRRQKKRKRKGEEGEVSSRTHNADYTSTSEQVSETEMRKKKKKKKQ